LQKSGIMAAATGSLKSISITNGTLTVQAEGDDEPSSLAQAEQGLWKDGKNRIWNIPKLLGAVSYQHKQATEFERHELAKDYGEVFKRLQFVYMAAVRDFLKMTYPTNDNDTINRVFQGIYETSNLPINAVKAGEWGIIPTLTISEHRQTSICLGINLSTGELAAVYNLKIQKNDSAKRTTKVCQIIASDPDLSCHPNLVKFYAFGQNESESSSEFYAWMRLYPKNNVREKLIAEGPFEVKTITKIAKDVLTGLDALHRHFIVHRDIKPDNILFGENENYLLSDYDISHQFSQEEALINKIVPLDAVGTFTIVAPELFKCLIFHKTQDSTFEGLKSADIYSFGSMLFQLRNKRYFPWFKGHDAKVLCAILNKPDPQVELDSLLPKPTEECSIEKLAWDLIRFEPNQRPNIPQIQASLLKIEKTQENT
jgi:hypothetical protein